MLAVPVDESERSSVTGEPVPGARSGERPGGVQRELRHLRLERRRLDHRSRLRAGGARLVSRATDPSTPCSSRRATSGRRASPPTGSRSPILVSDGAAVGCSGSRTSRRATLSRTTSFGAVSCVEWTPRRRSSCSCSRRTERVLDRAGDGRCAAATAGHDPRPGCCAIALARRTRPGQLRSGRRIPGDLSTISHRFER